MGIQIPKSIKPIAEDVEMYVVANYPHVMMIEDVNVMWQAKWEEQCKHELYYQDVNRYIGDIYQRESLARPTYGLW